MDFYEILEQVLALLQRHGRVTYRSLTRQFDLDNEYLEDLKDALLFTYPVVDEDGRGLVWTGEPEVCEPDTRRGTEEERHFQALLLAAIALLQRDRRVTYRTLKHILGLDGALLDEIREELTFQQLARDEHGKGLVWIGETQPMTSSVVDAPIQTTALPVPSPVTKPIVPSNGPTVPPETISTDAPKDEPAVTSEPPRTTPEAERRQLTVMFCDIAESTKLSQELDPEDLREVIRAYQQTSAEMIQRFDGYVAQHLGDGLLIYFGWPRAHEDDAQRALHSGLGIVEAITTTLNPRLETEKGVQLTVRLGIHTGPVVVGEMGGGDRLESLATGETVNIAARLEGLAQPNTVVISSVTERLVRGAFTMEDLGHQELKGVTELMQIFRVLSPTEAHRDEDDSMPDGGVFLVGRDEEIGLLVRRWEQAKEGLGQVVFISGEAGIGKSSLVATMRRHVSQEGYTRITFRCSPYHTNSALYPVITHLEQMLSFDRDDTFSTKLDKLEQALKTTNLPLEESVPLLATLLSVPLEDRYPAPTQSPQQQRQQTLDTLVAWLIEESEKQPVLAVWEDLHWADPSTLEMLGLMVDQSPTSAILNLLTFRPEFTPPWPTRSHTTPITLNRLERPQVEALITHLVSGKILPTEVVEHIVTKTDGVPLYVEELTKMLIVSDLLQEETDQYVLTGPLSSVAIPDTLQDSLMARLDQMNTAKEVAQLGAVLGREFEYELIQAITSQDDETIQANLAQLVSAELLYQRGRPPRARYIFKHMLIQNVAYASLLRNYRQQVHQRTAQVLEEQFPETVATQPEILAHHYTESGLNEQAVDYWQQAGQRVIQHSANVEAISHLNKGLELLETLPETSERIQQELAMQIALGAVLRAVKGFAAPEVERAYTRAHTLCQQVDESPQLLSVLPGLGNVYFVRAEIRKSLMIREQYLSLAQRQQDPIHLMGAHYQLGGNWLWLGELREARAHYEQSLALYSSQQRRPDVLIYTTQDPHSDCLSRLAWVLWMLGYADQALQRLQQAMSQVQGTLMPFNLVIVLYCAARLHQYRREPQATQQWTEELLALATEHGFEHYLAQGMILRGWALTETGQSEKGMVEMCQGLEAYRATGAELGRPYLLALQADAYGKVGQTEEGLTVLVEAMTLVDKTEERWYEAELHRLKGELLIQLSSDNTTEAESCFQQAISIAQNQSAKSWELRAVTSLAKLWQSQGKRKEAHELLAPVYGWFTEGFDTADLMDAKALLDELK